MKPLGVTITTFPPITQSLMFQGQIVGSTYRTITSSIVKTGNRSSYNSGPGWQERRARGVLPPAPYSYTRLNVLERVQSADFSYYDRKGKLHLYGMGFISMPSVNNDSIFGPISTTSLSNSVRSRFRKKAAAISFDSLVFAGELKETVSMCRSLTISLARKTLAYDTAILEKLRRGKLGMRLQEVQEAIHDSWLTYAYGVKPAISDIEGGLGLLYSADLGNVGQRVSTGETYTLHRAGVATNQTYPYSIGKYDRSYKYQRFVSYRTGARAYALFPGIGKDLLERAGISWSNVLPALWELIPYSFLVDYFTNVGDVIQAYTTSTAHLNYGWGVVCVEDSITVTDTPIVITTGVNAPYRPSGVGQIGKVTSVRFSRLVSPDTMPELEVNGWSALRTGQKLNVGALVSAFTTRSGLVKGVFRALGLRN